MTVVSTAPQDAATSAKRRRSLLGIAVLALAWLGVLGTLVRLSANPVVLNRTQIAAADLIVQGEWVDPPGTVRVSHVWKGEFPEPTVVVTEFVPAAVPEGESIIPLSRSPKSAGFRITHGALRNYPAGDVADRSLPPIVSEVQPQIYPATPEVLSQLETMLKAGAAR